MQEETYLNWLVRQTPTTWWHDSADPGELSQAMEHAASGVTCNPVLAYATLSTRSEQWRAQLASISKEVSGEGRAETLMHIVEDRLTKMMHPCFQESGQTQGYVCAQVNPSKAANSEAMLAQAHRFHAWAPNISVKLPVTAAGLDVLEECAAQGICTTLTVSFTVPQVLAIGERNQRGVARALAANIRPAPCFAVIMIGRLDDYLRDIALDQHAAVSESDIQQAGLAVVKRSYQLYRERGYQARLLIAALRGVYHMTGLAGGDLVMSIHPSIQAKLLLTGIPRATGIDEDVPVEVIGRLSKLLEFVRSFEPDGMQPEDFLAFGLVQRTLTQFTEVGWRPLETFPL